jgi:hypothetical protein
MAEMIGFGHRFLGQCRSTVLAFLTDGASRYSPQRIKSGLGWDDMVNEAGQQRFHLDKHLFL